MTLRALVALALLALALLAAGCGASGSAAGGPVGERPIRVTTTTNFITDTARQIGGDRVEVTGLMGPGVDPHLYKASAGDVRTLREADVIFYGGLELEGKMTDLLDELAERQRTVAVTRDIPRGELLRPAQFEGKFDPHVWFDVAKWQSAARTVAAALRELDPGHAAEYDGRLRRYARQLTELDRTTRRRFAAIPRRSRVLITSHDAFNYFGRRYGFDVVAIQGISTATQATTADIKRVARTIAERDVKAVFVESSVPRQTIDAVIAAARKLGQETRVGGALFSDAAGDEGTPQGTYVGMVDYNAQLIARGLR